MKRGRPEKGSSAQNQLNLYEIRRGRGKKKFRIGISFDTIKNEHTKIKIMEGEKVFGTLELRDGSIKWIPKNGKKREPMHWVEFERLMRNSIPKEVES